jgi:subtilase family serine protease
MSMIRRFDAPADRCDADCATACDDRLAVRVPSRTFHPAATWIAPDASTTIGSAAPVSLPPRCGCLRASCRIVSAPVAEKKRGMLVKRRGRAPLLGALLLSVVLMGSLGVGAASGSDKLRIAGTRPSWATAAHLVKKADPAAVIGFKIYLKLADPAGAARLAQAVSNPKSASYGRYLTPAQFRARFAPSATSLSKVKSWLRGQGFTVGYSPMNNHYVSVEGTVAQAQKAFGTTFNMYKIRGKTLRAPASDITVPASVATLISGAGGLDESARFVQLNHVVDKHAPPSAGFRNSPPLSDYWAELMSPYSAPTGYTDLGSPVPWTVRGYTPQQIKGAYGISGYNGAGQTVAIIDAYASPTILQDVNQWSRNRGLPTMSSSQFQQVVAPGTFRRPQNPSQDPQGWYGEETLDVEAVHGMAPAAKIIFVGAPNNYRDLDAALNHVVDRRLARIVTNSYGYPTELLPKGYVKPVEDTLIQAAIEGIGVYFSSGDDGDNTIDLGFATASWPAASPWVTAVGGTSIGIGASNNRVIETGWGTSDYLCNSTSLACARTSWLYGSGGGVSVVFPKPAYQSAIPGAGRHFPDVAAIGDPQTGLLVGQTQSFPDGNYYDEYRIGGTSLSSPIFAGLMALLDQKSGSPHGFANPLFYAHPGVFYDVLSVKTAVARRNFTNGVDASNGTSDHLRTFDDYSGSPTQHTGPGWDNVTGLGTPTSSFLNLP